MTELRPDEPAFPTLSPGVTLLDVDDGATGALHSLVLDHLLVSGRDAVWVDARGHAATRTLARLAPGGRLLERVRVARGFTPYQHHSLLRALPAQVDAEAGSDAEAGRPDTGAGLVVVPAADWRYREGDLRRGPAERLVADGADRIAALAADRDVPVLLTLTAADPLSRPFAEAADRRLACELTAFGPRFTGSNFETLVYPGEGYVQTTLAYWRRALARRHPGASTDRAGADRPGSTRPGAAISGPTRPKSTIAESTPPASTIPEATVGGPAGRPPRELPAREVIAGGQN
ncbi:MAG: hypothetical protein ABEJ28_06005 [Salinigranum sp.]